MRQKAEEKGLRLRENDSHMFYKKQTALAEIKKSKNPEDELKLKEAPVQTEAGIDRKKTQ